MSITDQSLPQQPGPLRLLPAVARSLDAIITDIRSANDQAVDTITAVRTDADEKIRALEVTCVRLAADLERERTRANGLQAAGEALVADHLRREEQLQKELSRAGAENTAQQRVNLALQGHLDDANREGHRQRERNSRLVQANEELRVENSALQADLAQAGGRHRFRRGR